jgi:hypothetical protein
MKDTVKKGLEGCKFAGAEALMELEENCAAISAALAGCRLGSGQFRHHRMIVQPRPKKTFEFLRR